VTYDDLYRHALEQLRDTVAKDERASAGFALGRMRVGYRRNRQRRKRRKWTGYLADGSRAWIGRRVILPNETVAEIVAVRRGCAAIRQDNPFSVFGCRFGLFKTADLRTYKCPAAVALGRAKLGVKERPSARKDVTSARNGCQPPRPSSRPRGRPRKIVPR
jgi:hypothetical protein